MPSPEPEVAELPALAAARDKLAAGMVPAPEDLLSDLDPITALFYVEQTGYALLLRWTQELAITDEPEGEAAGQVAETMQAIAQATGMLDAACVLMGLIPPEASDQ